MHRSERLEVVAKQIRMRIAATEHGITLPDERFSFSEIALSKLFAKENKTMIPQEFHEPMTTIDSLHRKYQILEKEYRQWPFRKLEISGYIFTVALPLVLSLIQAIGQLVSLYR
jgi:hypothetical protein